MRETSDFLRELKVFGMQNFQVEADLLKLEASGLDIGHSQTIEQKEIVDVELFEADIRKQARKMSAFYYLYFCIENSVRNLIVGRLQEKYGADWWNLKVPDDVKKDVEDLRERERETPVAVRSEDPIFYTNFSDLIKIIESNWDDFSDTLRSKKAAVAALRLLNRIRNPIAHSCELEDDEIQRFQLAIKDWQRIQI